MMVIIDSVTHGVTVMLLEGHMYHMYSRSGMHPILLGMAYCLEASSEQLNPGKA
jgi:hypothetical protein